MGPREIPLTVPDDDPWTRCQCETGWRLVYTPDLRLTRSSHRTLKENL
jgi:hypothetical protein